MFVFVFIYFKIECLLLALLAAAFIKQKFSNHRMVFEKLAWMKKQDCG